MKPSDRGKLALLVGEIGYPALLASVVASVYTWLSFRTLGYDWSIWEIFSYLLASAGSGSFPFFSYFYNGGVYLAHDPQALVTSPLYHFLSLVAGGKAATRWLPVGYALFGFIATYAWLRTRFTQTLSGFGAITFTLSLGMFWRMVGGHMLFLLEMIFPLFLWLIVRIDTASTLAGKTPWVILLALAGAWMIYEPGFHALFYFIFPGLFFEMFLRFSLRPKATIHLIYPLGTAMVLASLVSAPKIMSWLALEMTRGRDLTDGTISLRSAMGAFFISARAKMEGIYVPNSNPERWHHIFEVNNALMPIACVFAVFGIFLVFQRRIRRDRIFLLAGSCLLFSVLIASHQPFWDLIQRVTSGGIRVPSRFLTLGAFGLAVFSVYGMEAVRTRLGRRGDLIVVFCSALVIGLALNWLHRAQKNELLGKIPLAWKSDRPREADYWVGRYCPVGSGCLNTYQLGYENDPYIRYLEAEKITEANFASRVPERLSVDHTRLVFADLQSGEAVDLPFRAASRGHQIRVTPTDAAPTVTEVDGHLRIGGDPTRQVERIEIRPSLPFPKWSLWVAAITAIGCIAFLLLLSSCRKCEVTAP